MVGVEDLPIGFLVLILILVLVLALAATFIVAAVVVLVVVAVLVPHLRDGDAERAGRSGAVVDRRVQDGYVHHLVVRGPENRLVDGHAGDRRRRVVDHG